MLKFLAYLIIPLVLLAGLARLAIELPMVQDIILKPAVQLIMNQRAEGIPQPDALQAYICGSASPLAAPGTAQACVAIMTPQHLFIVDSGAGSTMNLMTGGLPIQRLQGVLVTHFHSDHIAEIPEVNLNSWVAGRPTPLVVYGPKGVKDIVSGLNRAYEQDRSYRTTHHGEALLPPHLGELQAETIKPGLVLADGDLTITAYLAEHDPAAPAVGYRFDYRGRSIYVSGDSNVTAETAKATTNLDLLLHDALSEPLISTLSAAAYAAGLDRNAKVLADVLDYHAWTSAIAELNDKQDIGLVGLYHLVPVPQNLLFERIFMRNLPSNIVLTKDRQWFTLPANTQEIIQH
ncbi:MAG: MBL fold metallo-hydrolase [Pseudomonadales bacterium]